MAGHGSRLSAGPSPGLWISITVTAVVLATLVGVSLMALVFLAGGRASAGTESAELRCAASNLGAEEIPARFMPIYAASAERSELGDRGVWVLAAIHRIETGFGEGMPKSEVGALGPMQFMPTTWSVSGKLVVKPTQSTNQGYATDGDGDGLADIANVYDAIYAAGRLLKRNKAPKDWRNAIFSYNHADWYVEDILKHADAYEGSCTVEAESAGFAAAPIGDLDYADTSGAWAGSMKFAKALAALGREYGCTPTSEKRPTEMTASGGVSDHWTGSTTAYAVDIAGCSLAYPGGPLDKTAAAIAAVLGFPGRTGVEEVNRGRYRFQMLWQTNEGGNHYNHVHIGVKLIG